MYIKYGGVFVIFIVSVSYLTSIKHCLQIFVDGQDIREVMLESLRKCIGVVPQDTVSVVLLSNIFLLFQTSCLSCELNLVIFCSCKNMYPNMT